MFDWLTSSDSVFWLVADRVATVLSYGVLVTVVVFLYDLWHKWQRVKRMSLIAGATERPRALALSHGGGSIKAEVAAYLERVYPGRAIPVVEHRMGELTPRSAQVVIDALRQYRDDFQNDGVTELHLFLKTTTAISVAAGAIFDNWKAVKVYQHDRNKADYEPWLTLAQAKAMPMKDVLEDRVLQALDPQASTEPEANLSAAFIPGGADPEGGSQTA